MSILLTRTMSETWSNRGRPWRTRYLLHPFVLYVCFRETKNGLKQQTAVLAERFDGFKSRLVIVQVGGRDDSNVYIRQKIKSAVEVGVEASHVQFPKTITQGEVCVCVCVANPIWTRRLIKVLVLCLSVTVRNQQIQRRFVRTRYYRSDAVGLYRKYRFALNHKRRFPQKGRWRVTIYYIDDTCDRS